MGGDRYEEALEKEFEFISEILPSYYSAGVNSHAFSFDGDRKPDV